MRSAKRMRAVLDAEQNAINRVEPAAFVGQRRALASAGRGRSVLTTDEAPSGWPAAVA